MTVDGSHVIYPQYCFHLSPTIEKWCAFRAREIHGLTSPRGFEGQDLYFHLNHPVRWVQVAGVVVAIDEFYGRRIYTIDDSSGANIEVVLRVEKQNANQAAILATEAEGSGYGKSIKEMTAATKPAQATTKDDEVKPQVDSEVDVGDVLLVKGKITVYRNNKQIMVYKIVHLRSTQDEVQFWKKTTEFHDAVLSRPWTLTEKELKRCRREAEKSNWEEPKDRQRSRRKAREADGTGLEAGKTRLIRPDVEGGKASKVKATGLEKGTAQFFEPVEAVDLKRRSRHVGAAGLENTTTVPSMRSSTSTRDREGSSKMKATGLERGNTIVERTVISSTKVPKSRISASRDREVSSTVKASRLDSGSSRLEPVYAESDSILDALANSTFDDGSFMETRSTGLVRTLVHSTGKSKRSLSPSTFNGDESRKLKSTGLERTAIATTGKPRRSPSPSASRPPAKSWAPGLTKGSAQFAETTSSRPTSIWNSDSDTLVPVRSSTRVRTSGLEKGATTFVKASEISLSSSQELEFDRLIAPSLRKSSVRARATGLERKPKRVKTVHVEGKV